MNALRHFRGGIVTAALLAIVVAGSQVVTLPRLFEQTAFSLSPEGSEVSRLSPVTVTFSKAPVGRETPAALLQVVPTPPGSYAWLSPKTLLFQPDFPGLLRGATYTAIVPQNDEAGVPQTVAKKFTVAGKLTIQQAIPGDGDTEVPLNAQVLLQFSRSVAPLTTLAAQPTQQVVTFDPPLHGKGEWLNTSIYRFIPSDLVPTTTYRMRVAKGLTSAADGVLESDFTSAFTTISPAVDSIVPDGSWLYGGPWQEVVVTFNQPMAESAAASVTVKDATTGAAVAEKATWNGDHTVLTLNPTQRMTNEAKYVVTVPAGVASARGPATQKERTSTFQIVGAPTVVRTSPANGATNAGRYGVSIQFNSPMDATSFDGKISISGFDDKDLEGRISVFDFNVGVNVPLAASTTYTVTLRPGAMDRYGQVMSGYRFTFTTGALDPSVALAVPGYSGSGTYSSSTEPILWFQTTNKKSVTFTLYPLTDGEARTLMHDGRWDPKWSPTMPALRTWTEQLPDVRDEYLLSKTSLSGGGPLPTGYYYVTTDGTYSSHLAFAVVDTVLMTKVSLDELLVWALDHDTGRPISGMTLHGTGTGFGSADKVTDANGLASFQVPVPMPGDSGDRSWYVTTGGDRFGVVSTRWQGVSPFQFGLPMEYGAREYVGHVYTDRPLYRPGETVHYKGIVRVDDDAQYSLPSRDGPYQLVITNARGQSLKRETMTLDDFGSFEGSIDLPVDAPLGDYSVGIQISTRRNYQVAWDVFSVAEFRKPEFLVDLTTDRSTYVTGDTIAATTSASFFFGGALEGAKVDWSAIADPYTPRVKGFESYSFGDWDWTKTAVTKDATRAKGSATTGSAGTAAFSVPAALNAAEGAQRFTISANVTDQNGQSVAGSAQVVVLPASVYPGIRSASYLATVGNDAVIRLVAADASGNVVPGQTVRVLVYDRQWITTKVAIAGGGRRYQSDVKDTLIDTLTARTGADGTTSVAYRPAKAGTLRLVAEVTDAQGRVARSAAYLWVGGGGFALWQVTNDDTIKLVADKDRYQVGDVAEVLVPAPFAGATALVSVERGKIITRETRTLATNSERLRIPIVDHSVPDVFVSVVLYRGPTKDDPLPRYKVGYVELPVATDTRRLDVKVTPDREQTQPGETVRYAIKVTDSQGNGVRAQLSVAVVDKAVLSLMDERGPDGMHAFWFERGLAVQTTSSMVNSLDRWNDVIAELPKQGKGGSGSGMTGRERETFRNTAYWTAQLVTKDDGTATVDVLMPDDLTTWHLQARAISGDTMVGEGTNEIVSTKPVLLRSALPRFLRVGDDVDLRVLVRNGTKQTMSIPVTIAADGVQVSGGLTRTQTVAPGASVAYVWPAKVTAEGTVKLTFRANGAGDAEEDAMTVSLPAYVDLTPETMSTGGVVTSDAALEAIYLPKFADTAHGTLGVSVRSALVGSLASELPWFARQPGIFEEGTEWIASRLIATLAVARAEQAAKTSTSYRSQIDRDIADLVGRQRPDGGWAWCTRPECVTDPNVTGWVLVALGEARRDGITIDSGVAGRASSYVNQWMNRPNQTVDPTSGEQDQKAFLLAAFAASGGKGVLNMANSLLDQYRTALSNWGRAYLANAFIDGGAAVTDAQPRMLLNDLAAATIPSANGNHWEDPSTSSRYSFMTSTATTALVALALARIQPQHQLLAQTVRWLVVARDAQKWETSVDRAMSILALSTYTATTGELGNEFAYDVSLDDAKVLSGTVKSGTTPTEQAAKLSLTKVTPGTTSILSVRREFAKQGRLYYTLDLRYMTPARGIEAVNRGFAVSHTFTTLDDPTTPITTAKLGETIRVTVTVIAQADRNYVTVEDLLPAGLEGVDASLKTTDPALRQRLESDRQSAATRGAGGYMAPWFRWYWSPWQTAELHDDRAVLRTDRLTKGVYEYVYYARATTTGDFFVAPAHAEETYFPEVFGRSDSSRFRVTQ